MDIATTFLPKGLFAYSANSLITIRFSEELDSISAKNFANYNINNVQINEIDLNWKLVETSDA